MLFSLESCDVLPDINIHVEKMKKVKNCQYIYDDGIIHNNTYYFLNESEIPIEDQCVVCFGYTDKKKATVPCGHRKFCSKCIEKMEKDSECYICRTKITTIINLYD
jgi:hypothetical protein